MTGKTLGGSCAWMTPARLSAMGCNIGKVSRVLAFAGDSVVAPLCKRRRLLSGAAFSRRAGGGSFLSPAAEPA